MTHCCTCVSVNIARMASENPGEPIDTGDQDIVDTAEPELRAFCCSYPNTQQFLVSQVSDAENGICAFVGDPASFSYFEVDPIEVDNRVQRSEWTSLPFFDERHDFVGRLSESGYFHLD